jgi:hypothetical protein
MKTLILIAVIVGMNAVVKATDPQVIRGNDGSMNRQSTFPDNAQTSRFSQTNQIQHGSSTGSGSGTGGSIMNVPSSTINKPSGVMTNVPSSTLNVPSGVMTNSPSSSPDQPSGTNGPNDNTRMP